MTTPHSTPHATPRATTEGTVYTVTGGDWDEVVETAAKSDDERIIVNMGPQHPSTHGVLRLILEIEGETVTGAAAASVTCTPVSRRTSNSATGRRAPPSSRAWTT